MFKNLVGFIEQLQTELKSALVDHQAHVLVRVLQKRLDTLTFGELRTVMDSRLGQGLATILVRDMVAGLAATPVPVKSGRSPNKTARRSSTPKTGVTASARTKRASAKSASKATTAKAKSKATTAKATSKATNAKAASKSGPETKTTTSQARPPKVSALTVAGRESYDNALVEFLRAHPGFNRPSDIRMSAGGTKLQLRSAMQRLSKAGVVERQGSHSTTRYAIKTV